MRFQYVQNPTYNQQKNRSGNCLRTWSPRAWAHSGFTIRSHFRVGGSTMTFRVGDPQEIHRNRQRWFESAVKGSRPFEPHESPNRRIAWSRGFGDSNRVSKSQPQGNALAVQFQSLLGRCQVFCAVLQSSVQFLKSSVQF